MQPTTIRFKGQVYRLAMPPEALEKPHTPPSEMTQALKLKQDILDILFSLGIGTEDRLADKRLPEFLPIDSSIGAERVLNVVNNYILATGRGQTKPENGARAKEALDAVENNVNSLLVPAVDKIEALLPQLIELKPALRGSGRGMRFDLPVGASTDEPVFIKRRLKFKGATYKHLWYPVHYAGWMQMLEHVVPKAQEEVDKLLSGFDVKQLKEIYYHTLAKGLRRSMRELNTALSALYTRVATVVGPSSILTMKELEEVKAIIPTLLEQLNMTKMLLNYVVEEDTRYYTEYQAIKEEEERRRQEYVLKHDEPETRGRPRKVVPVEPPVE